ncbi:MAG: hypothetical protein AB1651_03175 [Pseudomonadota bacterium]
MSIRQTFIVPVCVLALLAGATAAAQPPLDRSVVDLRREQLREKRERQFRAADVDRSRSLTREEIEAAGLPSALLRRFDEIDADGDGGLAPEELEEAQRRRIEAARATGDADSAR